MIERIGKRPGIILLTPQEVNTYLAKKPEYKKIWDQLVPEYFSAEEFCDFVNYIRIKRIERTENINQEIQKLLLTKEKNKEDEKKIQLLKIQKNNVFLDLLREVFNNQIAPRIKNTLIDFKSVNQLIGSLANFNRSKKEEIEEVTLQTSNMLQEIFNNEQIHNEGLKNNNAYTKKNEILHNAKNMNDKLFEYEDEILGIIHDLTKELFWEKEIGYAINQEEKRMFASKAREIFLSDHKEEIQQGKINVEILYNYLHKKKIL